MGFNQDWVIQTIQNHRKFDIIATVWSKQIYVVNICTTMYGYSYTHIHIPLDPTERMFNSTWFESIQMVLLIKTAVVLPCLFTEAWVIWVRTIPNLYLENSNFFPKRPNKTNKVTLILQNEKVHGYINNYT